MVGPIDMQSVILNSYTQTNVNNNLLIQAAQADNVKRIAQKKQQDEENTKVESAQNSQNPNIHEQLSQKTQNKNQTETPNQKIGRAHV